MTYLKLMNEAQRAYVDGKSMLAYQIWGEAMMHCARHMEHYFSLTAVNAREHKAAGVWYKREHAVHIVCDWIVQEIDAGMTGDL